MQRIILVTGPEPEQDKYGDEYPVWFVTVTDENRDEEFFFWKFNDHDSAVQYANDYGGRNNLDVEIDAMRL